MPILEYFCENCKKPFEELVKKYDEKAYCPICGKEGARKWSGCVYSQTGKPVKKCSGHCATCSGCN